MKLLIINPNTSENMTGQIEKSVKAIAPDDAQVEVVTNIGGPVSIEGHTDETVSAYHILKYLGNTSEQYDGYLIACFSNHPSVAVLRELTGKPALGIAEAACHMAAMAGNRFGIVTTSPKWVPMLEEAVVSFGLNGKCAGVFSSGLSVTDLHDLKQTDVEQAIFDAGKLAVSSGAEVICLGCAGMSGLQERMKKELKLPVIDSCEAGLMQLYALCTMGIGTSRICMYSPNMVRETIGLEDEIGMLYK